jgi:hypothetical protein
MHSIGFNAESCRMSPRIFASLIVGLSILTAPLACHANEGSFAQKGKPLIDVLDPALLAGIEDRGFRFGHVLGKPEARTTKILSEQSAAFQALHGHLSRDLNALKAEMKASGRDLSQKVSWNTGRTLNLDWLRSPHAQFRLVGIVNRQDRQDFAEATRPRESCGEVRFVYRLSYRMEAGWFSSLAGEATPSASRLPFNLNVVYERPRSSFQDCSAAARAAVPDRDFNRDKEFLDWLVSGMLDRSRLRLKQIEVNAQVVRLPSEMEPELGGQAIYLMRIFKPVVAAEKLDLIPQPLENTPDLDRIRQDAALKRELIAYIKSNIKDIDVGVYQLPEKFLATKALSYSTFGSARVANHPFSALLTPEEFGQLPLSKTRLVRSAQGVIARLDNGSCTGCHQSGATAGFHFFGLDDANALPHNRVKQGTSPHYHAEAKRREAYIKALSVGREPNRFRPLSSAPSANWNRGGPAYQPANLANACIVPSSAHHLASVWTCRGGTICTSIAENGRMAVEFGQCVPERRINIGAGLACLSGRIRNASKPFNDGFATNPDLASSRGLVSERHACLEPRLGVPGGLNYRRCQPHDLNFDNFKSGAVPDEICGMGGGAAFDQCAATGDFTSCLDESIVRQNRQVCGKDRFCREDYACQALPGNLPDSSEVRKDWGYCSPTYFLFQMRLDGHPDPI